MSRGGLNFKATTILAVLILVAIVAFYRMSSQQEILKPPAQKKNLQVDRIDKEIKPTSQAPECKDHVDLKNVYSRDDTSWKRNEEVCRKCQNFIKSTLKTQFGNTPIFIYESKNDVWVSGVIQQTGSFEASKTNGIISLLRADPKLNFIDIGANIGVHTLAVAKMGRKVLAIEALDLNMQHLCASVGAGKLQDNITLIHNALTDGHKRVKLGKDVNNMGGTYVDEDSQHIKDLKEGRAQGTYGEVNTITMDDLVELPAIKDFSKVIIKMDIEGFEHKAVSKSEKFFKEIDVQGFVMEWEFHRKMDSGKVILKRMKELKFEPYRVENPTARLPVEGSDSWPYDVLWRPVK